MLTVAELISTIGVPAVVVLLLLDRVVALVRARWGQHQDTSSGSKSTDYWEAKIGQIVNSALNTVLVPALERQNTLLEQQNAGLSRLNEHMAVMLDRTKGKGHR